jgi:hypothetical protein
MGAWREDKKTQGNNLGCDLMNKKLTNTGMLERKFQAALPRPQSGRRHDTF